MSSDFSLTKRFLVRCGFRETRDDGRGHFYVSVSPQHLIEGETIKTFGFRCQTEGTAQHVAKLFLAEKADPQEDEHHIQSLIARLDRESK